jgi:hypothetical protein
MSFLRAKRMFFPKAYGENKATSYSGCGSHKALFGVGKDDIGYENAFLGKLSP